MSSYGVGYTGDDRFDIIENEINSRFNMFNNALNRNIKFQVDKFADIEQTMKSLQIENTYLTNYIIWYTNLSFIKKLWYKIRNYNLKTKYESYSKTTNRN